MHQASSRWRPTKQRSNSKRAKQLQEARNAKQGDPSSESEESEKSGEESEKQIGKGKTSEKFKRFSIEAVIEDGEYFILHSSCLQHLVSGLVCKECKSEEITVNIADKKGSAFKILVSCHSCGDIVSDVTSSPRVSSESTRPPFDINRKMVDAFVKVGAGHKAMMKFGAVIGIQIMDQSSYRSHLMKLCEENVNMKKEVLRLSREAVRKAYEEQDPSLIGKLVIDIVVTFDGSWHKRGHTSLYGFVSVIDVLTGLVVDYEILSKYCHMCAITTTELGEDSKEFKEWYEKHIDMGECNENFEGFSGNMESAGAVILWKRSEQEVQMRYTKYVSDGDAKSLTAINKAVPYGPDVVVEKEECVNHVGKRLGTGLRNVISDCSKRGITLGGKAEGALTQAKIDKLQGLYQRAMLNNAPDIEKMKAAILATPHHYVSTDKKPQHKYCPKGKDSWCFYQKGKAEKPRSKPSHSQLKTTINQKVFEAILPTYKRLSETDLVERCKRLLTQNNNEALHNVVWTKVPKVSFIGKGRLELGVTQAIGEYNMGVVNMLALASNVTERPSSAQSMRNAESMDRKRLAQSDLQALVETKKQRSSKKKAKKAKKPKGKDNYGAGIGD